MPMREHLTVVTRKGQITIPADIRRALDLKEGDKVAVVQEGNEARLARRGNVVERTKGALKSALPPLAPEELREQAERAIAEDVAERMGG
jgi:AbrB family looped-hinge helix DNA binding protein